MRTAVLGAAGSPDDPPANTLLAALPADLRAVLRLWHRWIDGVAIMNAVTRDRSAATDSAKPTLF